MRGLILAAAGLALTATALAQPYYVRGDFNGWTNNSDPMVDQGGGKFSYTVNGLTPGAGYEFKATVDDWSFNAPGSNAKMVGNDAGQLNVNFFPNTSWADGWMPNAKARLGYADPGKFGWELMGSVNGWGSTFGSLVNQGGGLYSADVAMPAGTYDFKFRSTNDWTYNLGDDFGNSAANNQVTVGAGGETIRFELDLPNGRWRTTSVPEPASLTLLALGGMALIRRR